jgi:uncharacterized iron-regulated protein
MFKKVVYLIPILLISMMLSGCTAMVKSSLGKGKEYKFTDEDGALQTYYCKEVSVHTLPMEKRAQKAFNYFNTKNSEMSTQLMKDLFEDKKSTFEVAMELNKNAELLAEEVLNKYDCVLLDYED